MGIVQNHHFILIQVIYVVFWLKFNVLFLLGAELFVIKSNQDHLKGSKVI